jgi:hypothetical protein
MKGYITEVRARYGHPTPTKPVHSPHLHREIIYGAKEQYATTDIDTTPPLDTAGIKWCQGVIGSLLFYARAVDNKLLMTISAIGASQASATENTLNEINKLLDYCATYTHQMVSRTEPATWSWRHTLMQASSVNPNHAAEPGATSSSPKMTQFPATMAHYSPFHV